MTITRIKTVAFQGIDTFVIHVQVQMANGLPNISVVSLPDKAVDKIREGVRTAFASIVLALPMRQIFVNLCPTEVLKESSAEIAARVAAALAMQRARYASLDSIRTNAEAVENVRLSARGYHRFLKVARALADLDGGDGEICLNVEEAISYRRLSAGV